MNPDPESLRRAVTAALSSVSVGDAPSDPVAGGRVQELTVDGGATL